MEVVAQYATWYNVAYLITGILIILGLKYMSSPKTARFGNRLSMAGMLIALIATFRAGRRAVARDHRRARSSALPSGSISARPSR